MRQPRLLCQIERLGGRGLHPVGELETRDPRREVGLRGPGAGVGRVERGEQVEVRPLRAERQTLPEREVVDGDRPPGVDREGLVALGQESRRPDLVVAAGLPLVHDDEAR